MAEQAAVAAVYEVGEDMGAPPSWQSRKEWYLWHLPPPIQPFSSAASDEESFSEGELEEQLPPTDEEAARQEEEQEASSADDVVASDPAPRYPKNKDWKLSVEEMGSLTSILTSCSCTLPKLDCKKEYNMKQYSMAELQHIAEGGTWDDCSKAIHDVSEAVARNGHESQGDDAFMYWYPYPDLPTPPRAAAGKIGQESRLKIDRLVQDRLEHSYDTRTGMPRCMGNEVQLHVSNLEVAPYAFLCELFDEVAPSTQSILFEGFKDAPSSCNKALFVEFDRVAADPSLGSPGQRLPSQDAELWDQEGLGREETPTGPNLTSTGDLPPEVAQLQS